MKRVVLAAVAALTVLGQAQLAAAAGKDTKGTDAREVERTAHDAKDAAGAPAQARSIIVSVSKSYPLDATTSRRLSSVLAIEKNGRVRDLVNDIASSNDASKKDLNKELLAAASHLGGIDLEVGNSALEALDANKRDEQNAVSMILGAGKQAKNWSGDTLANYTALVKSFNAHMNEGKSAADSLRAAAADLKNDKKVSINLDDLRKLCEG